MNIPEKLQAMRERFKSKPANFDHLRANRKSPTIGQLKAERLQIKNMRRAENGMPPKATYAEI